MNAKQTLRLQVDLHALDGAESQFELERAADLLRSGGTVAFPTETVYGLGANALDAAAVESIFAAKQRPSWDPLIVHVADHAQLEMVVERIPGGANQLIDKFWPGPLTLLLPKAPGIPGIVTAGRPRVGVRMPSHPVARRLIELAGVPVAAPSANSFGRTSPTRAEFVLQDLDGRIDAIVDAGETTLGLESTVVDICENPPVLYRPGMITFEQVQAVCPDLIAFRETQAAQQESQSLASPGIGMKHYSPRARLVLVEESDLAATAQRFRDARETVGVMWPQTSTASALADTLSYAWGDLRDHETLAHRLFAGLRELDAAGVTVIVCPRPENLGLGVAIRDRLDKAAR